MCLTLCNPMDCRPTGSSVHGISQARILEWVAVSFSRGSSWPRKICVSCIGKWILYHRAIWEAPCPNSIRKNQRGSQDFGLSGKDNPFPSHIIEDKRGILKFHCYPAHMRWLFLSTLGWLRRSPMEYSRPAKTKSLNKIQCLISWYTKVQFSRESYLPK